MKFTLTLDEEMTAVENHIHVLEEHEGMEQEYYLTPEQVITLFANSSSKSKGRATPMLSRNTIRMRELGEMTEIWTEVPKQQWEINFEGITFKVGFPRLVFKYQCFKELKEGYKVKLTQCVAVQSKGQIKDDTPLYHFPYSHVSAGNVCMGGNQLPPIKELTQLETYHAFFFKSPFGADYGAQTTLKQNVSQLLTSTFSNKEIDDNVLVPMEHTFNSFFKL